VGVSIVDASRGVGEVRESGCPSTRHHSRERAQAERSMSTYPLDQLGRQDERHADDEHRVEVVDEHEREV
jgi:hypothetical protein